MKPRPFLSEKTKFVFAKLDEQLPVDEKALQEMVDKRLIVRVRDHAFLRRRFEAAGKRLGDYIHIYAIPFRRPTKRGEDAFDTLHKRSIHTRNAPERQFVFKGTGSEGGEANFSKEMLGPPESQFRGGARVETITHVVRTLQKLEDAYEKARNAGDLVVRWAAAKYGINSLPVMKHVAVFQPLQFLSAQSGRVKRVEITNRSFMDLGLAEFYKQERVHAYSVANPTRISEFGVNDTTRSWIRTETGHTNVFNAAKLKLLKEFITRGILLMHIAHSNELTLGDEVNGSPFAPRNASLAEFCDFDTAGPIYDRGRHLEYYDFAQSICTLAKRLSDDYTDAEAAPPLKLEMQVRAVLGGVKEANEKNQSKATGRILKNGVDKIAVMAKKYALGGKQPA